MDYDVIYGKAINVLLYLTELRFEFYEAIISRFNNFELATEYAFALVTNSIDSMNNKLLKLFL